MREASHITHIHETGDQTRVQNPASPKEEIGNLNSVERGSALKRFALILTHKLSGNRSGLIDAVGVSRSTCDSGCAQNALERYAKPFARRARRGVSLYAASLALALLMPLLSLSVQSWAEACAERQANALAQILQETGKGIEASLAAGIFDKSAFGSGEVQHLAEAQLDALFAAPDMPQYLALHRLRDFDLDVLVGRQEDGPVEAVVVLSGITPRGDMIATRLSRLASLTTPPVESGASLYEETVAESFVTTAAQGLTEQNAYVAVSAAHVAGLDVTRVIRQDRQVPTSAEIDFASDLDMGGFDIAAGGAITASNATSTEITAPTIAAVAETATLDGLRAATGEADVISVTAATVSETATAARIYVAHSALAATTNVSLHTNLTTAAVAQDHQTAAQIGLESQLTSIGQGPSGSAHLEFIIGVTHSATLPSITGEGLYADALDVSTMTTATECPGC